ncbi:MAG: capsule assembly Wzi family protein [Ignavibacterium album]|uniref:capsule assembly Wzi family protein n=1 Tax=Ignavibacterium album TaxID=591197 RepID=UPI0026E9FA27|nr:capsule assembly Wzi family protein [Ignavibacterium album]MCX8104697.1 capsule assembly Wzi family protein [Ignavibacterium album]
MKFQLLAILILISINLFPQSIYERTNSESYIFLESMWVKGLIEFHSELKPLSRKTLAEYLLKLEKEKYKLNATETELLEKYKIDLEPELRLLTNSDNEHNSDFLKTKKRLRFFEYYSDDFSFYADPVLSLEAGSFYDKKLIVRRNGFTLGGYYGKNWSYSLRFFDNEESGDNLDKTKRFSRNSTVSITKEKNNSFEYDEVTASIAYTWSDGSLSLNKDYITFGSGNFGKLILSDKAPPFPFIRFDFSPAVWLSFFYFHGFLQSNVADSNTFRYNSVPGRTSILEVPKYIAFHSLSFYPTDYLNFSIGESIIYSERIQPIYFIPVMFFRVADHYLGTGNASATGNAQMFLDASYLNRDIQTKFYSSLFIDELSFNSLFEGGNLSAIGYTIGAETHNIFPLMKLFAEYSRINPFVYMNSVDAQIYSNDGYKMGHWIESNGDILSFGIKKIFSAALSAELNLWYFRKGKTEAPAEQYSSPYPEFLYGSKRYEKGLEINMRYSPVLPVNIELNYLFTDISDEETGRTQQFKPGKKNSIMLKLSYQM